MTDQSPTPVESSPDFVQSLARGLAVIRVFDGDHASLTLSEVARRANLPRAAARRFLQTLGSLGYVRNDGRAFALTPRVLELGFSYLSSLSLPEILQPHLEALSREVDESVSVAVLDGEDVVYVSRVPTKRIMSVSITLGTRFPAFATSLGRVLLAALPEGDAEALLESSHPSSLTPQTKTDAAELRAELHQVRLQGWALVDGELELGLRSIAAPIRDRDGAVVAAVNISASSTRVSLAKLRDEHLPRLRAASEAMDADIRLL